MKSFPELVSIASVNINNYFNAGSSDDSLVKTNVGI